MGMHPDAVLFYGVPVPDDFELLDMTPEEEEDGLGEALIDRLRRAKGFEPLPWNADRPADYYERLRAVDAEIGVGYGVTGHQGYDAEAGTFLATDVFGVEYGPARITLPNEDMSDRDAQLDWALDVLGIPRPEDGYAWHLGASYS